MSRLAKPVTVAVVSGADTPYDASRAGLAFLFERQKEPRIETEADGRHC